MKPLSPENRILYKNTVMLYILQFSSYLLSFLTIPYQTRILGPSLYGVLGVATAIMAYFQLFLDFGFLLSATEEISSHRSDKMFLNKKLTSVTIIKLCFAGAGVLFFLLLSLFLEPLKSFRTIYLLYAFAYAAGGLLPDYFFRGTETMSAITLRTVLVKTVTVTATFALLQTPSDIWVIPFLLLVGNLLAVVWAYSNIIFKLKYRFTQVTLSDILRDIKRAAGFFFARIASTIYSTSNTVLLQIFSPAGSTIGFFTSADRVFAAAKGAVAPISDSLYPYMVKHRNFKTVRRMILLFEPVVLLGVGFTAWQAEPICRLVFGNDYTPVAPILRAFLPAIALLLPSYILGFPALGALGKIRLANLSIFLGMLVHLIGLVFLAISGRFSATALAGLTSISEGVIFAFRLYCVLHYKNKSKGTAIE